MSNYVQAIRDYWIETYGEPEELYLLLLYLGLDILKSCSRRAVTGLFRLVLILLYHLV